MGGRHCQVNTSSWHFGLLVFVQFFLVLLLPSLISIYRMMEHKLKDDVWGCRSRNGGFGSIMGGACGFSSGLKRDLVSHIQQKHLEVSLHCIYKVKYWVAISGGEKFKGCGP